MKTYPLEPGLLYTYIFFFKYIKFHKLLIYNIYEYRLKTNEIILILLKVKTIKFEIFIYIIQDSLLPKQNNEITKYKKQIETMENY